MVLRRGISKRKRISNALILLFGFLVIGLGALNMFAPTVDISAYQGEVVSRISQALHRNFRLDGKLFLKISLKPMLVTQKLTIDNPKWGKTPHLLQAEHVEFAIDLLEFFRGNITIDRLILKQASIHLEQSATGKNNWSFGVEKTPEQSANKGSPLRLDYVLLDRVVLDYQNANQYKKFSIDRGMLHRSLRGRYRLELDSRLGDQKFTVQALSNRWFTLIDTRPLLVDLKTDLADNHLEANLEIQQLSPLLRANIKLNSPKLDVNKILKQLPGKEKKNSKNKNKPDILSALVPWMNKTGLISLQAEINRLRYGQYQFEELSIDNRFSHDTLVRKNKFNIKVRMQADKIMDLNGDNTEAGIADVRQAGNANLVVEGKGDTAESLLNNAYLKVHARDVFATPGRTLYINELDLESDKQQRLQVSGKVNFRDTSIGFTGQTGKNFIGRLHQQGTAYLSSKVTTGGSTVKVNASGRSLFKKIRRIHLQLDGKKLGEWSGLYGKRLPLIEHFNLDSRFDLRKDGIKSRYFLFKTRASKITGRFYYHYGKPAVLNARLENSHLSMADLNRDPINKAEEKLPITKDKRKSEDTDTDTEMDKEKPETVMVIPATDLMSLLAPTTDVNLEVKSSSVKFSRFTVKALDLKTRWQDKVLATQVTQGVLSDGELTSDIYLTVVDNEAAGKIEIHIKQLDYGKFMQELKVGDKMKGKADVNIHLVGFGRDFKSFLNHSDGIAEFIGEEGVLASKYLKLWGEDIAQYILPFNWFEKEETKLNCVVGRFDLTDGRLSSDSLLLDTEGMTIAGTGAIDLGTEEMAFELMPDPKNISLISLATPVKIRGTLARPRIEPHALGTTWTIGSLLVGLANPAILIARFAKLGSLGENPCLAAIGKKEGEEEETSILKAFKETIKFIQRPLDRMPDLE